MSTVPVATLVYTAMELSIMYAQWAQRAPSMTEAEALAAWAIMTEKIKASGDNFDAAIVDWKERHPEGHDVSVR